MLSCDCNAADLYFALERDAGNLFDAIERVPILETTSTDCCMGCTSTCSNPWTPNDYGFQDYDQTELTCAWEITKGDPNIIIDINDTNFEEHIDFLGTVSNGKPKIVYAQTVKPCGPIVGQEPESARHATKMSSIIGAQANNGIGMAGVANNCRIMYHIWGTGNFTDAAARGANVINCSWLSCLSSYNPSTNHNTTIDMVTDLGVVMVASSGNGNCSGDGGNVGINENHHGYTYPASYDNVISVTSVSTRDEYALEVDYLSCHNGCQYISHTKNLEVDISAPGYCVKSLKGCTSDHTGTGTSQAAAFTSGVVGLMLSVNPCLQPADVESILKSTADDVSCVDHAPLFCQSQTVHDNADYVGTAGAGRVNAYQAVLAAQNFQPTFNTYTITNDETWTDVETAQEIVIQSGARLTIRGTTLRMAEGAKIIVQRGAALELDDAKITNACANGMWGAVMVAGDKSMPHPNIDFFTSNAPNHGLVLVHNNSILENARTAISTQQEGGGSAFWGGIVIAHDSEFLNNRRDVEFLPFDFENSSEFINCKFLKERATNYDDQYVQSVSMWGVEGIDFQANDFFVDVNEMPIGSGIGNGYTCFGINTARASFDITGGSFEGFYNAVEVTTSVNGLPILTIDNALFNNNRQGFVSSGGHNCTLTGNTFDNHSINTIAFSVDDWFTVEGNTIKNFNIGIRSFETGVQPNTIRDNTFETGSNYGIGVQGINDELLFLCNDFTDVHLNVYLSSGVTTNNSVREWQGFFNPISGNQVSADAAANLFSVSCPSVHTHLTTSSGSDHFHYVHHNTNLPNVNPRYEPTCFQDMVSGLSGYANFDLHPINADETANCVATGHGKSAGIVTEMNPKTLLQDLKTSRLIIEDLQQQIDGGDTEELLWQVETAPTSIATLEALIAASPYLSERVLMAVVEKLSKQVALKVLAANAPFSKKIWKVLYEQTPLYSEADLSLLADIGGEGLSPMQSLSFELSERTFQHASLLNKGVYELVARKDFKTVEQVLMAEDTYESSKLLSKVYLKEKNYAAAQKLCNRLPERTPEESDYKELLQLTIDLESEGNTYFDWTAAQEEKVRRIADNATRTSMYAKAILRLVYQEDFSFPAMERLPQATKEAEYATFNGQEFSSFRAIPNPASQITQLQIPNQYTTTMRTPPTVLIRDITGREVYRYQLEKGISVLPLSTTEWHQGLYICHLIMDGKVYEQTKLIIAK